MLTTGVPSCGAAAAMRVSKVQMLAPRSAASARWSVTRAQSELVPVCKARRSAEVVCGHGHRCQALCGELLKLGEGRGAFVEVDLAGAQLDRERGRDSVTTHSLMNSAFGSCAASQACTRWVDGSRTSAATNSDVSR